MRIVIFFQILLLSTGISFAKKTQLLKDYDFNKGGYYLLGTFSESDRNGLRDTLGEFYTDSIPILNQFKTEWAFDEPSPYYACGYHYTVYICKNGLEVERFWINLNCNEIVTDKGYFYFDAQKLRMFAGKLKKPFVQDEEFSSLTEARDKRAEILKQAGLIMTETPNWLEYEGEFEFTYTYPKETKKHWLNNEQKTLGQLTQEIKAAYPGETFTLSDTGGSISNFTVNVKCNKTLADKFGLYPLNWKGWEAYNLWLTSFWTTKKYRAQQRKYPF